MHISPKLKRFAKKTVFIIFFIIILLGLLSYLIAPFFGVN
jgi:hypothetical protein